MADTSWTFAGHNLTEDGNFFSSPISGVGIPGKRNNNIMVPLRDGRLHARKYFDERTISFGMTFLGTSSTDIQDNIDEMVTLLGARSQGLLVHTLADATVRQAYAEVIKPLEINYSGPLIARGTVDFECADPFFRSNTLYDTSDITMDTTDPEAVDVANGGSAEEHRATIVFTGPLEHPKLEHIALGVWVKYDAHIANADTVTIDCYANTAVHSVSGNVINSVVHSGDPTFIYFLPGTNHCHATDESAAAPNGKVRVYFYPPYLTP